MAQFKVRARAVDMLGRQQVAGIPTAISELFKNAHDAYADRVEVDYYRANGLFVLRDDGLGMTKQEFEERWLMIGTESKLGAGFGVAAPSRDDRKPMRPIMGEKGIGRLAIAAIGPQVLLLTRSKRGQNLGELVTAFIHWGMFEIPGLDLDKIVVPVRTFPGGYLPNAEDVQELVNEVRLNVQSLNRSIPIANALSIDQDLKRFNVNPSHLHDYLKEPSLFGDGHGTQFYIKPADNSLAEDIEDSESDRPSRLQKVLIGFVNTMTPGAPDPPITAEFRYHRSSDHSVSLIGPSEFFTPDEFQKADHHVAGEFDIYGNFAGTVTVYNEPPAEYKVAWREGRGRLTECGPFKFHLAVVQGEKKMSKLSTEDYASIEKKLDRIAGVYIYRDGIRVLPYGDADVDFLEIEKRRTKSAKYYYFSHRNLFGVIDTSRKNNENLSEKAGREGFRENTAYLQFRKILMNFFIQVAADFFRVGGAHADPWVTTREELDLLDRARKRRRDRITEKRKSLDTELNNFFTRVENRTAEAEVDDWLRKYTRELELASLSADREHAAAAFVNVEQQARTELNMLKRSYKLTRPRGMALPSRLFEGWQAYETEAARLDEALFDPAARRLETQAKDIINSSQLDVDRRSRLSAFIRGVTENAQQVTALERKQTIAVFAEVRKHVDALLSDSRVSLKAIVEDVDSSLTKMNVSELSDDRTSAQVNELADRVTQEMEVHQELLAKVREQLQLVLDVRTENGLVISSVDETVAMEADLIGLQDQRDLDLQLVQLGMAIEVISHEFQSSVKTIRENLLRLKVWAGINPGIEDIYGKLQISFNHLDGYLSLFTPLHRRLYRQTVEIRGTEIRRYLEDLFVEKLLQFAIELDASEEFLKMTIQGFPSTFYPVFVNLVDNAIFWLRDQPDPRIIRLDVQADTIFVSDNGPGIPIRDRSSIFKMGFTRKPRGRGLGLYISRDVLDKIGYNLSISSPRLGRGSTFSIQPRKPDLPIREDV